MISIVSPVYNAEKYISKTIDCIIAQTYQDFELIMVDDGSKDKSVEIIESYKDSRVRCVKNDHEKKGAFSARNKGIELAKGEYLAFIDADDLWDEKKLERTLEYMKANDAAFVFTAYEFGDEEGIGTGKIVHVPEKLSYKNALSRTVIFTSTVLMDLRKLDKKLIFMPDIASEDTATWWNILRSGIVAYGLDENLVTYRRSGGSLSSNKVVAIKRIWNLYRKNEKLGVLKSLYYMVGWAVRAVVRRI